MKKYFLFILLIVIIISTTYLFWPKHQTNEEQTKAPDKPPVVDFFACGDYCPGPQEKYTVKVYQGVTDETQCQNLGGTPASFHGWTEVHYCLAQ